MIYFHKTQYIIKLFTNSLMTKTIRYELISRFLYPLLVIVGREGLLNEVFVYQSMLLMINFDIFVEEFFILKQRIVVIFMSNFFSYISSNSFSCSFVEPLSQFQGVHLGSKSHKFLYWGVRALILELSRDHLVFVTEHSRLFTVV